MISNKLKAFSLIELMVVIAIVGILASVAMPAYKNYIMRAKVISGITIGSAFATQAINTYMLTGQFPGPSTSDNDNYSGSWLCLGDCGSDVVTGIQINVSSASTKPTARVNIIYDTTFVNSSSRRNLFIAIVDNDGIIEQSCGIFKSSYGLLDEFRPPECQGSLGTIWTD